MRGDFKDQLVFHEKIANFLRKTGGKLYYFSTANVFDGDLSKPHYEEDRVNSCSDYGKFKINCEEIILNKLKKDACILRLPQVWGMSSRRMNELKEDLLYKRPIKVFPDLYIDAITDEIIALRTLHIINHGLNGIFHISTLDIISYEIFYKKMVENLGYENTRFDKDFSESGYFAILSLRNDEFPCEFMVNNIDVISYLTRE